MRLDAIRIERCGDSAPSATDSIREAEGVTDSDRNLIEGNFATGEDSSSTPSF